MLPYLLCCYIAAFLLSCCCFKSLLIMLVCCNVTTLFLIFFFYKILVVRIGEGPRQFETNKRVLNSPKPWSHIIHVLYSLPIWIMQSLAFVSPKILRINCYSNVFYSFFFVELKLVSIPYQIIRSNSCFISPLFLLHLSIFLDILSWIDRSHLVFFSNVVLPCCFISDELLLWRALGALTRLIKYFEWLDCINSPEIQGKFSESVLNL